MSQRSSVPALFSEQGAAWAKREAPVPMEVADRIWAVPVPIPGQGIRFVYSYLIADGTGSLTVVDPGWNSPEARQALGAGIARTGHAISDVDTILVTHAHPDHLGLAGDLGREAGATVHLHSDDRPMVPPRRGDTDYVHDSLADWLTLHGQPADLGADEGGPMDSAVFADLERPDHELSDAQLFGIGERTLRVLHTPGHTPGHACFVVEGEALVLTGDHLLPRISPNVAGFPRSGADPLGSFLQSLRLLADSEGAVALPSHEYAFAQIPERVAQIEHHHAERLDEICDRLSDRPGSTADELSQQLTWSRRWEDIPLGMQRAALSETVAHLIRLQYAGRVRGEVSNDRQRWWLTA